MPLRLAHVRWVAVAAVLTLAALLRFWALGEPATLVFDELYYVRDAVSQLAHGVPTTWPDDDPDFGGERARSFGDQPGSVAHPPLGKWIIGLGILAFGPDSGWGWRAAVAVAGTLTVAVTMRLGWLLSRRFAVACLAGLVLAIDGVHVVLSRVALLDGLLTLAVTVAALCAWQDHVAVSAAAARARPAPPPLLWRRPWLLAAGLAFGCAAAVKWSGLFPLLAFLLLGVVRDVQLSRRAAGPHPVRRGLGKSLLAAAIALPAAALASLASWTGWILAHLARDPGTPWPGALLRFHLDTLAWHGTLSAPHPYQSSPLTWPLGLRPTAMFLEHRPAGPDCGWPDGCVAAISPIPNVLITWAGLVAVLLLCGVALHALWLLRRGRPAPGAAVAAFVATGYLSGWLPWVAAVSRSAVFQFYAVVLTPFSALALALVLGALLGLRRGSTAGLPPLALDPGHRAVLGRRIAVAIFLALALAVSALFFPVWSGMPIPEWFWRAHLWLPGWR